MKKSTLILMIVVFGIFAAPMNVIASGGQVGFVQPDEDGGGVSPFAPVQPDEDGGGVSPFAPIQPDEDGGEFTLNTFVQPDEDGGEGSSPAPFAPIQPDEDGGNYTTGSPLISGTSIIDRLLGAWNKVLNIFG